VLVEVEGLAQEDGGQGALLGRNEQGWWADRAHKELRPITAARLNRAREPRGESGTEESRGRPRGKSGTSPEKAREVEGLAQADGGQGALLGRNEQG